MQPASPDSVHEYLRLQIGTASQRRLICLLHEQCTVNLRRALRTGEPDRRPILDRVQNMLVVLQRALVRKDPTSRSLYHLYDYCYCRLEHSDTEEILDALSVITPLNRTFDFLRKHPG